MRTPSGLRLLLLCVLTIVPAASATLLAWLYHYDYPFMDEWSFMPLLVADHDGSLTWTHLWDQFHEHRAIVLKVVMILIARVSGWNLFWEVAVSLLCAGGVLWVTATQIRRLRALTGADALSWATPLASLLLFSPSQWENWLCGLLMHNALSLLWATLGMVALGSQAFGPRRLAFAV